MQVARRGVVVRPSSAISSPVLRAQEPWHVDFEHSVLPRDLAQVISEPIFDVPRFLKPAHRQCFDPILGG